MTTTPTMTPIDWLKYVHRLPLDDYGRKLDQRTRRACHGRANVATICLLGLATFNRPATLAEIKQVVSYDLSPASFDGLVNAGLANQVPGKFRSWMLNRIGRQTTAKIQADLEALIAKLTKSPTPTKPQP